MLAACYAQHLDQSSSVMERVLCVEHLEAILSPNLPLPKTIVAAVSKAFFGTHLVYVTVEVHQYYLHLEAPAATLVLTQQLSLYQRQIHTLAHVYHRQ